MFNNLLKGNKGRTTTKILATLLVVTLTFANFALLATLMFESIAVEEKVNLDVYLELDNPSTTEVSKDINSEDLVLYVAVDVGGDGRLEKGSIDFSNSNFKSKESEQLEKNIEVISSGNKEIVKIPIIARKSSKFDLSLLNMSSQIKLTGEYIDKNGNSTNVDLTKTVKVNWIANEITQEEIEFSQEVITNKQYQINKQDKRVIQLLVKSNIKDNKAPVKSTKIEIENPIVGVTPEEVKVASYNTGATNGGTSVEFNNNQGSSWEYKDNKTYIELNNEKDEKNCVSWEKGATDELIITYIYSKETNVVPFSSKAKVLIEVYGNETKVEKENTLTLEEIEEKGKIVNIGHSASRNIYKGNMYLGQDTEYKTKYDLLVPYNLESSIAISADEDKANSENIATYYKRTLINRNQAINVFGNNGKIQIGNENTVISTIDLSKEYNEEYYIINYPENISKIDIITTETLKEGKVEIINEKTIKVLKLENIESVNEIATNTLLAIVLDRESMEFDYVESKGTISLLEPKTTIDVTLDKPTISSQIENELTITATLNANNSSNKLFENPTVDIELPKEITEVTLGNISLVNEEELKIESSKTEIKTNESGNKVISIVLEGKQTKYNTSALKGANIVINLKVKTNPFMADKDVEIKTICSNKGEAVDYTNNLKVVSKKGMLAKNSITIGENKVEETNNLITSSITENSEIKINSVIINNNGQKITNSVLTGSVPEGTDLKEQIHTNLNNATIYYSTKENPTSEEWTNQVEDYTTVKSFKIEIGELEQASSFEIFYTLNSVEEELKEKEYVESNISINYVLGEQAKQENITFKVINLVRIGGLEITQIAEHNSILKEREPVKFIVEVKNTNKAGKKIILKYPIPEEIQISKIKMYVNGELVEQKEEIEESQVEIERFIESNGVLKLEIEGITRWLADDVDKCEIKNGVQIVLENGKIIESEEIVNVIENNEEKEPEETDEVIIPGFTEGKPEEPNPEEPAPEAPKPDEPNPEEPKPEEPNPEDPKPEEPAETYSISGLAWLDKNKNGIRDNNEEILQGIGVALLDKNGNIVKNSENKEIVTITTITGTYKFNNVPKGEYIVVFAYDTSKYSVSKYQVQDAAQDNNSDVISKKLIINNIESLVGATDVIKINDSDIQNIDMGLVENAKFDLSLEKYVSKVIVTNDQESTTYNFEEANLAKVEIAAKRLAKSSIIVQYEIKISNDGDIQGYVNDVIDYLPKELTFNSEMNPDWYSDSEGNLHNVSLEKTAIEPGKSQTVKLVLTKTLNNNSVGTIENIAEIGGCTNLQGITEQDSISANKKAGEDDIGNASLIVSIKTGGPTLYVGIAIVSLLVLGIGIYLVDKKVLKGGVM